MEHPEAEYHSDLRIPRRFVQNGRFGYRESDDVIFQALKKRYPEAYGAFGRERELRWARNQLLGVRRAIAPRDADTAVTEAAREDRGALVGRSA